MQTKAVERVDSGPENELSRQERSHTMTTEASSLDTEKTLIGDVRFLQEHGLHPVVLQNESGARVVVSPEYQGRVMTSSMDGDDGFSCGWINYKPHSGDPINNYSGVIGCTYNLSRVKTPSSVIIIGESAASAGDFKPFYILRGTTTDISSQRWMPAIFLHNNGTVMNASFADGHVQGIPFQQYIRSYNGHNQLIRVP